MQNTEAVWRHVDAKKNSFIDLADAIWGMPELNFAEIPLGRRASADAAGRGLPGQHERRRDPRSRCRDLVAPGAVRRRQRLAVARQQGDRFQISGRASHAAAVPHSGRSALDAVELMNVGVNYMREHMPSDARIHYALLDAGGIAPNVVQARAKVRYLIRAIDARGLASLVDRVAKIAQGAAVMTETSVASQVVSGTSNMVENAPLARAMQDNFERLGPPSFDEADRAFAERTRETLRPDDIAAAFRRFGLEVDADKPLCDLIVPFGSNGGSTSVGSTDLGDVSWAIPTVYARGATYAIGTPGHSWQLTAQGKTPAAHKGMVHVAKVMAGTAIDVLRDPALLERAKADHAKRTGGRAYECPLPKDLPAPLTAMS